MYKCVRCGYVFEDGEQAVWEDEVGEFWGQPYRETYKGCPRCRDEYEEAAQCKICGKTYFKDDLIGEVCEKCIDEHRRDFDMCYKIADQEPKEISINGLLATLLDKSDIEAILYDYISRRGDADCSAYIDEDIGWFGEQLAKEVNK